MPPVQAPTHSASAGVHRVVFLNPGGNVDQVGRLRLINPGTEDAFVTIAGTDDMGAVSTEVVVAIPAGTAREWTAAELESGSGTDGALGDGEGKWRLRISSGSPVVAMSLIESPTGNLTNLSTLPRTPGRAEGTYMVPLLPSASDSSGRQGFVRVVNRSGEVAEVRIEAFDDTVWEYEPLALAVGADEGASFNPDDLELGNEAKGLTVSEVLRKQRRFRPQLPRVYLGRPEFRVGPRSSGLLVYGHCRGGGGGR